MNNTNSPIVTWIWLEEGSLINRLYGVLRITDAQWAGLTDAFKAKYRPAGTLDGVRGLGYVAGNFLLVRLD